MKVYYMHTINDFPAIFDGGQVCYMRNYGKPNPLALSLKQIREEQKASAQYRRKMGFSNIAYEYGYRRVCAP